MNPYARLGFATGTVEAATLSARLSAWHDAMVAHERRLRSAGVGEVCDEDCPHAEARSLWSEAIAAFGPRAHELAFLRSRAAAAARGSEGDDGTGRDDAYDTNEGGASAGDERVAAEL